MESFTFYLEAAKKKKKAQKMETEKLDTQADRIPFPCQNCKGYGKLEKEDDAVCPVCKGRGEFNSDEDRKMAIERQKLEPKVKANPEIPKTKKQTKKS